MFGTADGYEWSTWRGHWIWSWTDSPCWSRSYLRTVSDAEICVGWLPPDEIEIVRSLGGLFPLAFDALEFA